jgi:glycogen(starch) synthase
VLCVSQAVKKNLAQYLGLLPEQMQVIPNGIELDQFTAQAKGDGMRSGLSLLYAGNITIEKGVHTAIEALCILSQQGHADQVRLTIVGSGHPDYEAYLRALVSQYHLESQVGFLGRVPRREMPQIFQQHDVLVFPSTGEALPRVVQEAMACGLVVIGTTAGGTGEILVEGETGLTFSPGDAAGLANQISRLVEDERLYRQLQERGRDLILAQFDLRKTVRAIEDCLQQAASSTPSGYHSPTLPKRTISINDH